MLLNVNSLCESEPLLKTLWCNDNSNLYRFIFMYVVKLEKCQFVQVSNDDLAEDKESKTILGTRHLVVIYLCPSGSCSSWQSNIGKYIIDMASYLEAAIKFFVQDCEDQCGLCKWDLWGPWWCCKGTWFGLLLKINIKVL